MTRADQARALFARVISEAPDRWPAAVQTLIVSALSELDKLAPLSAPTEVKGAPTQAAPAAPPIDPAEAERRANLSPEELEREAMMDAAIAATDDKTS